MTTTTTTMEAFRTSTAAVAQASKSGIFTGDGGGDEKACANCGATQVRKEKKGRGKKEINQLILTYSPFFPSSTSSSSTVGSAEV